MLKITIKNYHGDRDINTRLVVRDCKQSFGEENRSSFGGIKTNENDMNLS